MPSDCFFEPWLQYKHPAVRQLAFAIASPNILKHSPDELEIVHPFDWHHDHFWQHYYQRYASRLEQLDQDPTALLDFLAQLKSTRLGLRFEMLIWFWLTESQYHDFELLGHSIQMIDGPRTLGELDFLLRNRLTNQIEHWEVALKYYLAERDNQLAYWYGLNRSDTLQRKLRHFTEKQFQFNSALNFPIQRRVVVLKGQLYISDSKQLLPSWVNPKRQLGLWGAKIPPLSQQFYRLQRQEWICPNLAASSLPATWWTDGLYHNANDEYFMYRQAALIQP